MLLWLSQYILIFNNNHLIAVNILHQHFEGSNRYTTIICSSSLFQKERATPIAPYPRSKPSLAGKN